MVCHRLREIHRQHQRHRFPVAVPDLLRIVCGSCEDDDICPSVRIPDEEPVGQCHSSTTGSRSDWQKSTQS